MKVWTNVWWNGRCPFLVYVGERECLNVFAGVNVSALESVPTAVYSYLRASEAIPGFEVMCFYAWVCAFGVMLCVQVFLVSLQVWMRESVIVKLCVASTFNIFLLRRGKVGDMRIFGIGEEICMNRSGYRCKFVWTEVGINANSNAYIDWLHALLVLKAQLYVKRNCKLEINWGYKLMHIFLIFTHLTAHGHEMFCHTLAKIWTSHIQTKLNPPNDLTPTGDTIQNVWTLWVYNISITDTF